MGSELSLGVARLEMVWAPLRLLVSLSSFVDVWLGFYHGEKQDDWNEMGITFLLLLRFMDRYRKTLAGHVLSGQIAQASTCAYLCYVLSRSRLPLLRYLN